MLAAPFRRCSTLVARTLCAAGMVVSLVACSEEGGSGSPPNDQTSTGDQSSGDSFETPEGARANGPLTGRLLILNGRFFDSFDLATGRWTELNGNGINAVLDRFPTTPLRVRPDRSGNGQMVFTAKGCFEGRDCAGFLDETGEMTGFTDYQEVSDPIFTRLGNGPDSGIVKRSRDGRYIAYGQAEQFLYVSELTVAQELEGRLSYDANVVSSVDIGVNSGSPYDWLPDGGLLYSQEAGELSNRIVIARSFPASTEVASSVELTGYRGSIRQIDVSPDGNYALLRFIESLTEIPLILDLRTNEVHEPVSREQSPFLDVGLSVWSPDSQWILFRVNVASNLDALVPGVPLDGPSVPVEPVYAMRIDGRSRALPRTVDESGDGARIVIGGRLGDPNSAFGPQNVLAGNHWVE